MVVSEEIDAIAENPYKVDGRREFYTVQKNYTDHRDMVISMRSTRPDQLGRSLVKYEKRTSS